jgi:beta-lactamase regulating signal transducer with metallopeptidase domain
MMTTLSDLGSGVILAWLALPVLAATVTRAGRLDPASYFRALALVFALGSALFVLPIVRTVADAGLTIKLPVDVAHALVAAREPVIATRFGAMSVLALLGAAWGICAAAAFVREAGCALAVSRVARLTAVAPRDISLRAEVLARELGVRAPDVRVSDECIVPFTSGLVAPRIVLPRALLESFEARALDLILLHELSHVARRDVLTSALMAVPRALFAFHPTARLLFTEIHLARELAVDAAVASLDADAYPKVLIDVACHARFGTRLYGAVGMHRTHLAQRLEALADSQPRRRVTGAPAMALAAMIIGSAFIAPRPGSAADCPLTKGPPPCEMPHGATSTSLL